MLMDCCPCSVCKKSVLNQHKEICCDHCNQWAGFPTGAEDMEGSSKFDGGGGGGGGLKPIDGGTMGDLK